MNGNGEKHYTRRNDLGNKITMGVLLGVISLLLTVFFIGTFNEAKSASNRSHLNSKDIATQKESILGIRDQLSGIKFIQDKMDGKIDKLLLK